MYAMNDMTMPSSDGMKKQAADSYPGVEFTPPAGTVGDETEGEAMVAWKKIGDRYTITEFEGKPMGKAAAKTQTEDDDLEGAFVG